MSVCFVPLLSAEPAWDEGDEEDDEFEEVLCSMASRESSERRRSGLLKVISQLRTSNCSTSVDIVYKSYSLLRGCTALRALPGPYELRTGARAQTYSSIGGILPNQGRGD